MKITPSDFKETAQLGRLVVKIDNLNAEYVNSTSDDIFQRQPFFLSVLIGYRLDLTTEELDEFMKIYFLIWEFFKDNKNVQTKKVTEIDFQQAQAKLFEMLKYIEGESDQKEIMNVCSCDIERLKSKSLLTAVFLRYNTRPVIMKMNMKTKGIILVGIRSFIECFEKC